MKTFYDLEKNLASENIEVSVYAVCSFLILVICFLCPFQNVEKDKKIHRNSNTPLEVQEVCN